MIMNKSELIDLIVVLIDEIDRDLNKEYVFNKYRDLFKQLSYEKWAYKEILKRITNDPRGAYAIVDDFCKELDECTLVNRKASIMFSCAYDAAMNVLDLIVCEDWRNN